MGAYTQVARIPKLESDLAKRILHEPTSYDRQIAFGGVFTNDMEMVVRVNGNPQADCGWCEAILYDDLGEVDCTDVRDSVFGDWKIEYNGDTYTLRIKEEM